MEYGLYSKIKNFIDKGDVFVHLAAYIPKGHYDSKNIINCYNYNVLKLRVNERCL